jgi:hypothetical protein
MIMMMMTTTTTMIVMMTTTAVMSLTENDDLKIRIIFLSRSCLPRGSLS